MGRALDREYRKAIRNVELFRALQKCRELDFPKNLNYIYLQNFSSLSYYYKALMCTLTYSIKTDYTVRTLVYNFVASVKSYLNRKRKRIDKIVPSEYKKDIQGILEKYWKSGREKTAIDKIVIIRDRFEHEEISDLSLTQEIYADKTVYTFKYKQDNFLVLAKNCVDELDAMNNEIESYINLILDSLNLRQNCLFLNAFFRKHKGRNYTLLFPEETVFEIAMYDEIIERLSHSD